MADPVDMQELVARCMGNVEFAERVLAKFRARLDEDLLELEKAVRAEDAPGIARVAHRIKGAAANVAAHGLRERAAGIEERAAAQALADVTRLIDELRNERLRLRDTSSLVASLVSASSSPPTAG
ncbi:MAG: Hpt domain-containing protein [Planctomycetia bacterium]|nr:Hpt domain-containing protein [Planctomycetia bacterium]